MTYQVYNGETCIMCCSSYEQAWDKVAELSALGLSAYVIEVKRK